MTKNEIKEFILESDLLNEDQVENTERIALKEGISFFDALLKLGFLDQEILSKITMRLIGIPAFNLKNYLIDLEIYKIIPEPVSLKHNIISFKEEDDLIYIAFCDTKSLEIIDDLFSDSNKKIKLFYVEYDDIQKHKKKYHSLISSEFYLESEKNLQNAKKIKNYIFNIDKNLPLEYYSDLLDDKYIENFINILLEFAIFSKASFIYLNTSKDKIKILFRIKGKNYEILKLDVDLSFSLFNKLKLMADINIKSKNVIEEASFSKLILDDIYDFVLTITQNDFNESISIEVKNFSDDFKIINFNLSKKQQELLLNYSETNKGIVCIRSSNNESSKRLLYSFLEREVKKDQEVYSIEDFVSYQVGFVNQISTPKDKDFHSVLFKILSNKPDVISVEKVTKTVFPILFNYAGLQKKIFLSANKNIEILIDWVFEFKFLKSEVRRIFSILIDIEEFESLKEEKQKYFLNKKEIKLINRYLTDNEIKNLFYNENLKKEGEKKLSKMIFYTKKEKKGFLKSKNETEKISIQGISHLGLFFEDVYFEKLTKVEIKNKFNFSRKKAILENLILASHRGIIDIKDIFSSLSK